MIYVFKTSVRTKSQVKRLEPAINDIVPNAKWNFDLQDRDRILRVDGEEDMALKITDLLSTHNFFCEELE